VYRTEGFTIINKVVVGITGMPGAGKGVFRRTIQRLGYPFVIMGDEVREEIVFENKKESGLEALLPPGEMYIYREEKGKVFFISKDNFPPVLPEGEGTFYLGQAKGLRGEKVHTFYQRLESGGQEYTYRIVLWNLRDSPVKIKVREHLYGEGEILESEPSEYVTENNLILYEIEITPKEEREVKYKARIK